MTDAKDVFPVPEGRRRPGLVPGPWMSGSLRPERAGRYLRRLDRGECWSWFRKGRWYTSDFWDSESPEQHAAWRGGVQGDVQAWLASVERQGAALRSA